MRVYYGRTWRLLTGVSAVSGFVLALMAWAGRVDVVGTVAWSVAGLASLLANLYFLRVPVLAVEDDALVVGRGPLRAPLRVPVVEVAEVEVDGKDLKVVLTSQRLLTISAYWVDAPVRVAAARDLAILGERARQRTDEPVLAALDEP